MTFNRRGGLAGLHNEFVTVEFLVFVTFYIEIGHPRKQGVVLAPFFIRLR
jgi:hypothetical protein